MTIEFLLHSAAFTKIFALQMKTCAHSHPFYRDLMDELLNYIREAVDRKQENGRRRRRKDALRLQLVRVLEKIAENKTFAVR